MPVSTQSKESLIELRKRMEESYEMLTISTRYISENVAHISDQNLHWLKDTANNFISNLNAELNERENSSIG